MSKKKKNPELLTEEDKALIEKVKRFYGKYKTWILLALGVLFALSVWQWGMSTPLTIVLSIALVYIVGSLVWMMVKWIRDAKSESMKQKRIIALGCTVVFLVGMAVLIEVWFEDTRIGQALQGLLYDKNTPDVIEYGGEVDFEIEITPPDGQ